MNKLKYMFICKDCDIEQMLDIPMDKYDKLKDNQLCPLCKGKLERKLEWTGIATGSGEGWYGKSDGGKAI